MSKVFVKDKRSNITYVYESKSYWDKEKKQPRNKRTLIGKLDEFGNIVKTDGRCKHLSKLDKERKALSELTKNELIDEIIRLRKEIKNHE